MINKTEAAALRRAIETMSTRRHGIPYTDILVLARAFYGQGMTLDVASIERIGIPIVVLRDNTSKSSILSKLSPREREVASLVVHGLRNKEIAIHLGISLATVKDHIHHVLTKTALSSRTRLAAALAEANT